ncbi:TetR family transcriptional regulator [Halalkalibacterium halodurans]|uniref:TetR family transcriptional regulator n=1 Tax=Halalkalibacterium halodurans TaxID=86665 RepID=UPI002E1F3B5C|nr:TetR family transcriptional regulator [Halalkalibacterium halodurans]MED4082524.1 TetR family transcriptional regulator [Halalkalibacterium halodurans]MED4085769.1 TetR family transcriptional regulator [Halalkalibacterium halodurans]MED4105635.1 TetR family transcriptional regulator [Halalkalibacterium halodurans]MED4107492.1 TetR family transcriptional regulator [Halalkalibacterium halodurans]MED4149494.1 TetR family transcriptional regulator [Halalkalibacterium halodurans]
MRYKSKETYRAILQAAIDVMKDKGFEKASIGEIAKRAGVAHGTFYTYFQAKNEIIPAIADEILQDQLHQLQNRIQEDDDVQTLIRELIDVSFTLTKSYKEVILLCYAGLSYYDSLNRWEEIYDPYYRWIEKHLKKHLTINIQTLVPMIVNLIEFTAERHYFANECEQELSQLKEDTFQVVMNMLR